MGLYWNDIELLPGMLLDVDPLYHEHFDVDGHPVALRWKILRYGSRTEDDAYFNYSTGKKYPLKKVVKSRRLQAKLERGELLQLPAGSDFMVVQEFHNGDEACKRCCNLDMLGGIRNIRVVEP